MNCHYLLYSFTDLFGFFATSDAPEHEKNRNGAGENIAFFTFSSASPPKKCQGYKTDPPTCTQCREMVSDCYSEIANYNFDTARGTGAILHFTQIVWKETIDLGMATAMSKDTFFTVARYTPAGNMPSDFKRNVPKPV